MPTASRQYRPPGWTAKRQEQTWQSRQVEYRSWYNLWLWRDPVNGIRAQVLRRDPLCIDCLKQQKIEPATEADHEIPHRGNWELFIDMDNIRGRCKECHSRKTLAERDGFKTISAVSR